MEMTSDQIKDKLKEMVGEENYKKLTPEHHAILEEGIEAALNGRTKIRDRAPETEQEILLCVAYHLRAANSAYEGMIEAVKEFADPGVEINVDYRGRTFSYKA